MVLKAAELIDGNPDFEVKLFVSDEITKYSYTSHEIYTVEISDYYDGGEYGEYGERTETDVEDLAELIHDTIVEYHGKEGSCTDCLNEAKALMKKVILIKIGGYSEQNIKISKQCQDD